MSGLFVPKQVVGMRPTTCEPFRQPKQDSSREADNVTPCARNATEKFPESKTEKGRFEFSESGGAGKQFLAAVRKMPPKYFSARSMLARRPCSELDQQANN